MARWSLAKTFASSRQKLTWRKIQLKENSTEDCHWNSDRGDASLNATGGQPWGFWATLAWGVCIGVIFIVVQAGVASLSVMVESAGGSEAHSDLLYQQAATDGDILGLATIASALVCSALVLAAATLRRSGNVVDYLRLYPVSAGKVVRWTALFIALLIALDVLTTLMDQPATPEIMRQIYASTDHKILLFVGTVVAASIFEELFFRGFLLRGFQASPLGNWGSVVFTAALWSFVHVQYDVYGIATIFAIGLFLGAARIRSGSTVFPMALHALNNAIAFFFLVLLAES